MNVDESLASLIASEGGRLAAELAAALDLSKDELDDHLRRLEARGRIVVVDHAPPDRHLGRADLRVVVCIGDGTGQDAKAEALAAAEAVWNAWLATFLSGHRCG